VADPGQQTQSLIRSHGLFNLVPVDLIPIQLIVHNGKTR